MSQRSQSRPTTRRTTAPSLFPPSQLVTHLADPATVGAIALHPSGSGLIMGVDEHGKPGTVMLFRPEPTVALSVGGLRLAQLIGFRALALGVDVSVQTGRPAKWSSFGGGSALGRAAGPGVPQVAQEQAGTPDEPRLLIVDSESSAVAEAETASPGPWSTVLTVRDQLSSWDAPVLARADIAIMQRRSAIEARLACPIMNIPEHEGTITRMADDAVALVSRSRLCVLSIAQTTIERRLIGAVDTSSELSSVGSDR